MGKQVHELVMIGAGALALEIATYLSEESQPSKVAAIVDELEGRYRDISAVLGYEPALVRDPSEIENFGDLKVLICVGDPHIRWKIQSELRPRCAGLHTLVHRSAFVAETAELGEGVIAAPFAFVGAFADVGDNSLLNVRATAGHDVTIGPSSVLSPHANMSGFAVCGTAGFLGAGAILDPSARLGHFSKLASGSVLKTTAGDGFLLHGNPAQGRRMYRVPDALMTTAPN
ncbi:MAG TPA: hypothetical protein VKA19_04605 [Alphaproteobacteria bacterium]|nr:hypothetical protein [Alphaproteobacteria bacterium]